MAASETVSDIKESIVTETETSTKVHGKTMSKMVSVNSIYRMVKDTKENLLMERNMVKAYLHGRMAIDTKDSLFRIKGKDLVSTIGAMEEFIKGSGRQIG